MPHIGMRWLGVHSSGESAISGLPMVEKRPQIPLSNARRLVEGSIESTWIGEEDSRFPEVVKRVHHILGRGQSGGCPPCWKGVVGLTENDLKSQWVVAGGSSRAQTRALPMGKRNHVPRR